MWISGDELKRGILFWDRTKVQQIELDDGQHHWAVLPDSKSSELIGRSVAPEGLALNEARLSVTIQGSNDTFGTIKLHWCSDWGNFETKLWWQEKGSDLTSARLVYAPSFGKYYRLVVDASGYSWDEDKTLITDLGDVIRFHTGSIYGHQTIPTGSSEDSHGVHSTTMSLGPVTIEGRFIEIIASQKVGTDPRTAANAILGQLNLILGSNVHRRRFFEGELLVSVDHGLSLGVSGLAPWFYDLYLSDEAFSLGVSSINSAPNLVPPQVHRALERYAQANATTIDELKIAACYSAIEVIAVEYVKSIGGLPETKSKAEQFGPALAKLLNTFDDVPLKDKLLGSLRHSSMERTIKFYAESRLGADADTIAMLKNLSRVRNSLYHTGGLDEVHDLVNEAIRFVKSILVFELQIPPEYPFSELATFKISAPINYDEYGIGKPGMLTNLVISEQGIED